VYYAEIQLSGLVSQMTLKQFEGEVASMQLSLRERRRASTRQREDHLHNQIEKRRQVEKPVFAYAPALPGRQVREPEVDVVEPSRGIWGAFNEVVAKEPAKSVRHPPRPTSDSEDSEEYKETQMTLGQMLGL
jgi:hypothetical protein